MSLFLLLEDDALGLLLYTLLILKFHNFCFDLKTATKFKRPVIEEWCCLSSGSCKWLDILLTMMRDSYDIFKKTCNINVKVLDIKDKKLSNKDIKQ